MAKEEWKPVMIDGDQAILCLNTSDSHFQKVMPLKKALAYGKAIVDACTSASKTATAPRGKGNGAKGGAKR